MADTILDWITDHVMGWILLLLMAACTAFIVGGLYVGIGDYLHRADIQTITLEQPDWACSKSYTQLEDKTILIGKIITHMNALVTHCTQWTHK